MEVRWSTLAADDLERIFERIAKDKSNCRTRDRKSHLRRLQGIEELSAPWPPRTHERAPRISLSSIHRCLPGQRGRRWNLSHLSRCTGLAL